MWIIVVNWKREFFSEDVKVVSINDLLDEIVIGMIVHRSDKKMKLSYDEIGIAIKSSKKKF